MYEWARTIILAGLFTSIAHGSDVKGVTHGNEFKSGTSSLFLSELGLSEKDLKWGTPINQIKVAALCVPGKFLVIAINNQSSKPLTIPVIDDLPEIELYDMSTDHAICLYMHKEGGSGMFQTGSIQLESGKMITFVDRTAFVNITTNSSSMTVHIRFRPLGGFTMPASLKSLVLESQSFEFPKP